MENKNILVLFDIDYTLFNAQAFRREMFINLSHLFKQHPEEFHDVAETVYQELRNIGYFPTSLFIEKIQNKFPSKLAVQEILDVIFDEETFRNYLYDDTISVLTEIKKMAKIGILSTGESNFQRGKIKPISHLLEEEFIFIAHDKKELLEDVTKLARVYTTFLVDDLLTILEQAKQHEQLVYTIHIKRENYSDRGSSSYVPDSEIFDLSGVLDIISSRGRSASG